MENQQTVPYPLLKQITDKLISFTLIVVFSPIFLLCFLGMSCNMLLRPEDRGEFFYRETRITQGREFEVLKFRVLRQDVVLLAKKERKSARKYESDESNLTWSGRNLLKKWYFDELPQLFNIFKGDMSLVGPRPWSVAEVNEQLRQGIAYRNLILAGWTGPTQVQVKGESLKKGGDRVDIQYLEDCRSKSAWKMWLYDLDILLRTVKIMFSGEGLKY
ncbi:MAG: sugar transferase [SAR324 cluster bacterium]|nr:sugar transferase [SAR324 cluster bacterium]